MRIELKQAFRIVTFIPPDDAQKVVEAVMGADPLRYGQYTQVYWQSTPGTEHYRGDKDAVPAEGKPEEVVALPSVRLEFSLSGSLEHVQDVLMALAAKHPCKEPVILVQPVLETRTYDKK